MFNALRDHPFKNERIFSEKLTFLLPDTHRYVCVSGGRKVNFSENCAYVLNGLIPKPVPFSSIIP